MTTYQQRAAELAECHQALDVIEQRLDRLAARLRDDDPTEGAPDESSDR